MGSTALQVCASAYRQANMSQTLSSFTDNEYPYNIAMDLINEVIAEINRYGDLYFLQQSKALTYGASTYSYDLSSQGVQPQKVTRVWRAGGDQKGEIDRLHWRAFKNRYRRSDIQTSVPTYYSIFNDTIEFNCIPDQDYTLTIEHFADMAVVDDAADTFPIPSQDEDLLRKGVYAYLLQRIGRPDFATAFQLFQDTAEKLRVDTKASYNLPTVMPAAF